MVEKPNKDGKPPTVEYQEEEIIVSNAWNASLSLHFTHTCPDTEQKITVQADVH